MQQLLAALLRQVLLGDVEGDDRCGARARSQRRRLDPREQPALAEPGVVHGVAGLGALRVAHRVLHFLELGQRRGLDDVTADRMQRRLAVRRTCRQTCAALAHPARTGLVGRERQACGVDQRTDLQLRQFTLFVGAAVFQHRHEALLAARRGVAAQRGAQRAHHAMRGTEHALPLHGCAGGRCFGSGLDRDVGAGAAPTQQVTQRLGCIGQRGRHRADEGIECIVRAQQQPGSVEQHHAHRAEPEPVVDLAQRPLRAFARHVLGGRILQHREIAQLTARPDERAARHAKAQLAAFRVEHAALGQHRLQAVAAAGPQPLAPRKHLGVLPRREERQRIAPDQARAWVTGERDERVVRVDDVKPLVLQQRRERRLPEHLQCFAQALGTEHSRPGRSTGRQPAIEAALRCSHRGRREAQRRMTAIEWAPCDLGRAPVVQPRERRRRRIAIPRAGGNAFAGEYEPPHRCFAERRHELGDGQARHCRQQPQARRVDESDAAVRIERQHGVGQQVEKLAPAAGAPRRLGRAVHSSSLAVMSARSWARLISATPIIRRSAASRKSNSDSLSAASTTSM